MRMLLIALCVLLALAVPAAACDYGSGAAFFSTGGCGAQVANFGGYSMQFQAAPVYQRQLFAAPVYRTNRFFSTSQPFNTGGGVIINNNINNGRSFGGRGLLGRLLFR